MYPDVITTNGVNRNYLLPLIGTFRVDLPSEIVSSLRKENSPYHCKGEVVVLGDIENATVVSKGNIHCKGSVSKSNLISQGSVIIDGCCSNSTLYVKQDVILRTVVGSDIVSESDITIHAHCSYSTLQATNNILGNKACVSESSLSAGNAITIRRVLHSNTNNVCRLSVGDALLKRRREFILQQHIEELLIKLQTLNEVSEVYSKSYENAPLASNASSQLKRIGIDKEEIATVLQQTQSELDAFKSYALKRFGVNIIVITSYADNNIVIEIDGLSTVTDTISTSTQFTSNGTSILYT